MDDDMLTAVTDSPKILDKERAQLLVFSALFSEQWGDYFWQLYKSMWKILVRW